MERNIDRIPYSNFTALLQKRPNAKALIVGSERYPDILGNVRFYATRYGVFVFAEVGGLPNTGVRCGSPVFGFHIHEGGRCAGTPTDPFADVGAHYNPADCVHPYHAGDLPPLWGADGYAFSAFLTNRFTVEEIVGKTVIIHAMPDDLATQPSGGAGEKIACGEIRR